MKSPGLQVVGEDNITLQGLVGETIQTCLLIQVGEQIVYQMKEVLVALVLLTDYQP